MVSATRASAVLSYRLAWGLWLVVSLLDGAVYRHIFSLNGADPRAVRVALLFLLQAIAIPIYLRRKTLESAAEAAIRGAAAAATFAGMTSFFLGLIAQLLGISESTSKDPRLEFGYVTSILLFNGIAAGIALGILRWHIVREQPTRADSLSAKSHWARDLRAQVIWIGCATLSFWLFHMYGWATANSPLTTSLTGDVATLRGAARLSDFLGRLPGAVGLFFISTIPFLLPPREGESWRKRILKYSGLGFVAGFTVSALLSLIALTWAPIIFRYVFPNFCVPSLLWGAFYALSLQPSTKSTTRSEGRYAPYYQQRPPHRILGAVWWSAAGYAFALLAGWFATTPVALGFPGAGCRDVSQLGSVEYWFWKAYKGFTSEVNTTEGRIVRLSIDPSICMTLDVVSMDRLSTPETQSGGYVVAAQVWSWLIDPEEWQSERTVRFRGEVKRLTGRDFSSYDELQAWWEQNGESLVWSSSGNRLEVRNPNAQSRAGQGNSWQRHGYVPASTSESVRQSPWLFDPHGLRFPGFNSLFLDREARLRALKLRAADLVQILTGERDQRIREYLHNLTGGDFASQRDWWDYFTRLPLPPCNDLDCPAGLSQLDDVYVRTPPDPNLWDPRFQEVTAQQVCSRHDDFLPWLQRPENRAFLKWATARKLIFEISDTAQNMDPVSQKSTAMYWLKETTNQSFDSPEKWVQWWQDNRSLLALSDDGLKLVVKRR
jgi:hypothetical protein